MELTDEQKERMQRNKEAALELRRQRLANEVATKARVGGKSDQESPTKKQRTSGVQASPGEANKTKHKDETEDTANVEIEAFEEGASEYVTKQDAMKLYCLPAGTVEMCSFIEKPNPRNAAWSSMKLYRRSDVRTRSRKRFGGLDGLVAERRKREEDRFKKDMENMKTLFR